MSDIPNDVMAETSSILPYDFVKQNNIFGIDNNGEIKIYSTSELSFDIHQELLMFLELFARLHLNAKLVYLDDFQDFSGDTKPPY